MRRRLNSFMLGCDPEFVVVDAAGSLINVVGYLGSQNGPIGYDHAGRVMELRPDPAYGAITIIKRLKRLLEMVPLPLWKYRWRAGASFRHLIIPTAQYPLPVEQNQPLGGHVHFDIPYDSDAWGPISGSLDVVETTLERLDILPRAECKIRRQHGYGLPGNYKASGSHVEYRTFPSWLYDPKIAHLCLTAAKIAAAMPFVAIENAKNVTDYNGLKGFFEKLKGQDADVDMVLESTLTASDLKANPDANIQEAWALTPPAKHTVRTLDALYPSIDPRFGFSRIV